MARSRAAGDDVRPLLVARLRGFTSRVWSRPGDRFHRLLADVEAGRPVRLAGWLVDDHDHEVVVVDGRGVATPVDAL